MIKIQFPWKGCKGSWKALSRVSRHLCTNLVVSIQFTTSNDDCEDLPGLLEVILGGLKRSLCTDDYLKLWKVHHWCEQGPVPLLELHGFSWGGEEVRCSFLSKMEGG